MKPIDSVKQRGRAIRPASLWAELPARAVRKVRHGLRVVLASKVAFAVLLLAAVVPIAAFEAHVVNVTATIERRPCVTFEVRSKGFWSTHSEFWTLPQTLGNEVIQTPQEAQAIFNLSNSSQANKLKKQLLTLKFNIAYFNNGMAFVPDENITLLELVNQADALLLEQNPSATNDELEDMKDLLERVNTAETVTTCHVCPKTLEKALVSYEYFVNGSSTSIADLSGNVNKGDHVRVVFTLAEGCEEEQYSLVVYKAPNYFFNDWEANEQTVFDAETGFFPVGPNTMDVTVPACFFQIDFVKGTVIEHLGPEGTDNFYSAQGRLIDHDNGDPEGPQCDDQLPFAEPLFMTSESLVGDLLLDNSSSTASSSEQAGSPQTDEGTSSSTPDTLPDPNASSTPTSTSDGGGSGGSDSSAPQADSTTSTSSGQASSPQAPTDASSTPEVVNETSTPETGGEVLGDSTSTPPEETPPVEEPPQDPPAEEPLVDPEPVEGPPETPEPTPPTEPEPTPPPAA